MYIHTHNLIPLKVQCDTNYFKRNSEIMTCKRAFFLLFLEWDGSCKWL